MKNILIVLPTATLGGAERVMCNLAAAYIKRGDRVLVYAMSRGEKPGWEHLIGRENFTLIAKNYKSEKTSLVSFSFSMFSITRSIDVDFVISTHTHVNAVLSLMRRVGWLRCRKLISRESTFIFERFFGWRRALFKFHYKYMYGSQDLLLCQTEGMMQSLVSNLGFLPVANISVISNPVDIDSINLKLSDNPPGWTSNFVNKRLVVACGRLIPVKNYPVLIDAFRAVATQFPDLVLVIIGDGPEKSTLSRMVSDYSMLNSVIFIGRVNNVAAWFSRADVGIVVSIREGFPNVLLEMMCSGARHIITTPCSDGVYDLPFVTVTSDHSAHSLSTAIATAIEGNYCNQSMYKEYVAAERSCEKYLKKLDSIINVA